jgi:hypothetical protein
VPNRTDPLDARMNMADAALETLRSDVIDIVLGTVFLTGGATACTIAAICGRRSVRILVRWGIFSGMYGLQTLWHTPTILTVLPQYLRFAAPYVNTAVMYLLLVSGLFAWRQLTLGKLRSFVDLEIWSLWLLLCWVLARLSSAARRTNGCSTTICS